MIRSSRSRLTARGVLAAAERALVRAGVGARS